MAQETKAKERSFYVEVWNKNIPLKNAVHIEKKGIANFSSNKQDRKCRNQIS